MKRLVGIGTVWLAALALGGWLGASPAWSDSPEEPSLPEKLGERAAGYLRKGEPGPLSILVHVPPTYSPSDRDDDLRSVERSLAFLLERFGAVSSIEREQGKAKLYEVGIGAGDVAYWESIAPIVGEDLLYRARFQKLGEGFVRLRVFTPRDQISPEIQSVNFGLAAGRDDAKPKMAEILAALMQVQGIHLEGDVRESLMESLEPVEVGSP